MLNDLVPTEFPGAAPQPLNNPMQNMATLTHTICKAFHADTVRFHVPGQVRDFNVFTPVNTAIFTYLCVLYL